jgi:prepilin-type N-terminal cleavage/methylation domain-containing protein
VKLRERCHPGGFTLVELLVATLIGSLIVGAQIALFRLHGSAARRSQAELVASDGAAWALAVVARDLELAGADPRGTGVSPLVSARADRVVLDADLDGDGHVDTASAERTTVYWSSSSGGRLLRQLGNQSTAIAARVPSGGFRLRYFDASGNELAPAAGGDLDPAALVQVRSMRLELTVAEAWGSREARVALRTAAAVRIRAGRS